MLNWCIKNALRNGGREKKRERERERESRKKKERKTTKESRPSICSGKQASHGLFERWAFSREEEGLGAFMPTTFVRVKSFFHRPAYRRLHELGLASLPPGHGIRIPYHQGSRTWTGYFNQSSAGTCFTHGGSTKRSECEALILCIRCILQKYTNTFPRDAAWKAQLDKVLRFEASSATI